MRVFGCFPICENTIYIYEIPARLPRVSTGRRSSPSAGRAVVRSRVRSFVPAFAFAFACSRYTPATNAPPPFHFSFHFPTGRMLSRAGWIPPRHRRATPAGAQAVVVASARGFLFAGQCRNCGNVCGLIAKVLYHLYYALYVLQGVKWYLCEHPEILRKRRESAQNSRPRIFRFKRLFL